MDTISVSCLFQKLFNTISLATDYDKARIAIAHCGKSDCNYSVCMECCYENYCNYAKKDHSDNILYDNGEELEFPQRVKEYEKRINNCLQLTVNNKNESKDNNNASKHITSYQRTAAIILAIVVVILLFVVLGYMFDMFIYVWFFNFEKYDFDFKVTLLLFGLSFCCLCLLCLTSFFTKICNHFNALKCQPISLTNFLLKWSVNTCLVSFTFGLIAIVMKGNNHFASVSSSGEMETVWHAVYMFALVLALLILFTLIFLPYMCGCFCFCCGCCVCFCQASMEKFMSKYEKFANKLLSMLVFRDMYGSVQQYQ